MLYLFLVLIVLFFLSDIFFRKTFHMLYGKPIPRNANTKEVREFTMSMMDEAEKQISYEENFEVVVKLSNYVLPLSLIAIFLVGIAFHTIIKSRGVIYVRNQKFREELWQEASLVRD